MGARRRIKATPALLRHQVEGFADFLLLQREQAQQLGPHPSQLRTIEIRLDTIRDLSLYLCTEGRMSWASVTTADLESFLALAPVRRASRLRECVSSPPTPTAPRPSSTTPPNR